MHSTEEISIRPAREQDIEAMLPLLKALFAVEADFNFDEDKQREGLKLLLESGKDYLAVAERGDGQVVGMCSAQSLISTAEGGRVGMVEDLVVSPGLRGRDIGTRLLRAAEDWAKAQGLRRLQLLADKDNRPALGFYLRRGWSLTKMICLRKLNG